MARWRNQPVRKRLGERHPITALPRSISLIPHLRQARSGSATNVTEVEHMDMIVELMKTAEYDKYHKPMPNGELEVEVNMFIDTIKGNISRFCLTLKL